MMKISFRLSYNTVWGETLHAVLYRAQAGANERKINIPLSTQDGKIWTGSILLLFKQPAVMAYHYEVRRKDKTVRREWQKVERLLSVSPSISAYYLNDAWRDLPAQAHLYSSAVTEVFRPQSVTQTPLPLFKRTLSLRVQAPYDGDLYLCGSTEQLGNWNPTKALPLTRTQLNEWEIVLNADEQIFPAEYKFIAKSNGAVLWEDGFNRTLDNPPLKAGEVFVRQDLSPRFTGEVPVRAAGVVVPVFSLRSKDGCGVGDFGDLKKLADWTQKTGQKVIQILPLNDTTLTHTWQDSYPYNAVSVYALHPLYADVRLLPGGNKSLEKERKEINELPQVDYERTLQLKLEYLKRAFLAEGKKILSTPQFRRFFAQNTHWLPAYAMFCTLRDHYKTADFSKWGKYAKFSHNDLVAFCKPGAKEYGTVCFWYYVQFLLHCQLSEAARYARQKGIILKGDIPIGVSPNSAEAWAEPQLFYLNTQAGAPPDDFSATGQTWGFPTYNWDEMAQNGYRWWTRRLVHMAQYFDAYRIDHVLGFFRIWQIPLHAVQGLLGQFAPALPMSADEIKGYGLPFDDSFICPHITAETVREVFGDLAEKVSKKYLELKAGEKYQLKPEYSTQRQTEQAFVGKTDETAQRIKEGLFALAANVLFVPDHKDPSKFHPRISALASEAYRSLSVGEQQAFTRLYNDYFFHRHNEFWKNGAMRKLPAVTQATRMLCCAEDLGMIPACVPEVLNKLQILSLEIERMPKRLGETFADTKKYPYLSVATPSTHDMSVLRGWWKEKREITARFWSEVLEKTGEAPAELDGKTAEEILRRHLNSPSMLALISYQDWTSMDETLRAPDPDEERINVPANPRHYWRYRMPITLEKLLDQTAFNDKIRQLIKDANR